MIKQGHELVADGPYRFVRHPIYTGLLLALFGNCLADGMVWGPYVFGLAGVLLLWKLKLEESLMLQRFPEAYAAYPRRTKALVPFIL